MSFTHPVILDFLTTYNKQLLSHEYKTAFFGGVALRLDLKSRSSFSYITACTACLNTCNSVLYPREFRERKIVEI